MKKTQFKFWKLLEDDKRELKEQCTYKTLEQNKEEIYGKHR